MMAKAFDVVVIANNGDSASDVSSKMVCESTASLRSDVSYMLSIIRNFTLL